jgi:hypothetical protein
MFSAGVGAFDRSTFFWWPGSVPQPLAGMRPAIPLALAASQCGRSRSRQ